MSFHVRQGDRELLSATRRLRLISLGVCGFLFFALTDFHLYPSYGSHDEAYEFTDKHTGYGSEADMEHQIFNFSHIGASLRKKIVIVISVEVGFGRSLTAERLTITDFLKVVQTAGNAAVTVRVESVEVDGRSAVHA